ncbi:phosphotransferase enzyme family protein [Pleomorphovibrio marinus]|uniref:phosphotransferase enzyme family protein n=1 Tax=Pleomorphovibrio marinus TaxID=2164132 RepID=UPI000E0CA11F|nr:aminoglycoside phosphotransferase family protein [Pleomorphovibrio marinus]
MKAIESTTKISETYNLGGIRKISKFGSGHIHNTYLLNTDRRDYILQGFNDTVFRFPDRIANNLRLISEYEKTSALPFALPLPIPNQKGELFTKLDGELYRLFQFVDGATKDALQETYPCKIAASAFSNFVKTYLDLDATLMQETIQGFHDLSLRFDQFQVAVANSKKKINGQLSHLVDFYLDQKDLLDKYKGYCSTLPLRVTHNDTKINNLIFNHELNQVNAVIDLDTIMAGYVFYDFGDLVRTVACTEDEGSVNWENIGVDLPKYHALIDGFFEPLVGSLDKEELQSLIFGGEMMTCIMGLRFLTDYLNGNIYYQISYPEQNFHRSKNQRCLLQALKINRPSIQEHVNTWVK